MTKAEGKRLLNKTLDQVSKMGDKAKDDFLKSVGAMAEQGLSGGGFSGFLEGLAGGGQTGGGGSSGGSKGGKKGGGDAKNAGRIARDIGNVATLGLLGSGKGGGSDGEQSRGELVKHIMAEKNMSLPQASKYVKENNLYVPEGQRKGSGKGGRGGVRILA